MTQPLQDTGTICPTWYGLRVLPRRERTAQAFLDSQGVRAFYPVTYRSQRRSGRVVAIERPYIPGYVFARFVGEPRWHVLLELPWICGWIAGPHGYPAPLAEDGIERLQAMRAVDAEQEAQRISRATLRRGDRVRLTGTPLAGQTGEVVRLNSTDGIVEIPILGATRHVRADLGAMEKMHGGGDDGVDQ